MSEVNQEYLAKKLSLSISTVSKALKGYSDVKPATRN